MVAPRAVVWSLPEHTLVKHDILEHYLQAWLPIMATQHGHLVLVDGFAGPGRFGRAEGSPLVMIRAYTSHDARATTSGTQLTLVFIERNAARFRRLEAEVRSLQPGLPQNLNVLPIHASFADVMGDRAAYMGRTAAIAPSFVFIDPFGYGHTKLSDISNLLSFGRSEVFVYVPLWHIARFLNKPELADTFTKVFGDDRWKGAQTEAALPARHDRLHELFGDALGAHARYVRSFEMRGRAPNSGYHLFFGSNHPDGLRKMKAAMWLADPYEGSVFRDPASPGQTLLLQEPCFEALLRRLHDRFGASQFTIEQALEFTLLETPFRDDAHLKKPTLGRAELAGCLRVSRSGSRNVAGEYPRGTVLCFIGDPELAPRPASTVEEDATSVIQIGLW